MIFGGESDVRTCSADGIPRILFCRHSKTLRPTTPSVHESTMASAVLLRKTIAPDLFAITIPKGIVSKTPSGI